MNKYYLHFIGSKLYPKQTFINEANEFGVNRCLPLYMINKLKWGDHILIGRYIPKVIESKELELCPICRTELIHFTLETIDVFGCPTCQKEVTHTDSIKEKYDGRKNKSGGEAEVFGYFVIQGLNITASDEFKKKVMAKLDVYETLAQAQVVKRQCGSYTIGVSHLINNTIEDIIGKIKETLIEKLEHIKVFVSGKFYELPASINIQPVNFSRTLTEISVKDKLTSPELKDKVIGMIENYDKRSYIKTYEKRGRPRKVK
jgi:hypothetical protein